MSKPWQLLFTCEHASPALPTAYRKLAGRAKAALCTHRGYDVGTLTLGRQFARHFDAPLIAARYTRLLVDLNRSLGHPALWSEFSRDLAREEKARVLVQYYHPHRDAVERAIEHMLAGGGRVLHIGVHSFTPVLHGEARRADVGVLYDPARPGEKRISRHWKTALASWAPTWRVRMNYPYRGVADGLVTHLRRCFPASRYAGLELEVNQALVVEGKGRWKQARECLVNSLSSLREVVLS